VAAPHQIPISVGRIDGTLPSFPGGTRGAGFKNVNRTSTTERLLFANILVQRKEGKVDILKGRNMRNVPESEKPKKLKKKKKRGKL